uniref:2,5-diketo-D-gluconate reductase A n=1 Tax=Tetraselmis sp. GSL018 TaxID=582737 RepID=A0A061RJ65_9CHLO|mmetsp:Transcript_19919/g.47463  ORF Transcript_19919/g.47463 Transcript_19919/m.47463 type:complete len:282 (+) Transcript_19919:313-1158(+)|eukprot:CAMPEP_0177602270 /NCGR_PEP_ID=MMETSP0419_2-20121207/14764_1 /TAXON_ID=582737 /ORGANISM="Tetraselmis sp., Strain GSL018" /LENGTH=281 /DNA_ID=CAMNT_0019095713 /DNA_START=269 /DNA_END=1114 /DNA_ORIENTATION=+
MSETCKCRLQTLNDGNVIPQIGFGVCQLSPGEETYQAVSRALVVGYRNIDTASIYGNEADVGRAVRDSGIPRESIFITSKLWTIPMETDGYNYALREAEASLRRLQTYIDLYLIHSPHHPLERVNFWRALELLKKSDKVRSIGVSNFGVHHLQELLQSSECSILPAVNQIEFHPFFQRYEIEEFCKLNQIQLQAWAPLARAKKLDHPVLKHIADYHGKTAAQVLIRFSIDKGYVPLPRTSRKEKIRENFEVFDFTLSEAELEALDDLDERLIVGWDPVKLQ